MAKAKRDRRASIRNMPTGDVFDTLDRLEEMERQERASGASSDVGEEASADTGDGDAESTRPD